MSFRQPCPYGGRQCQNFLDDVCPYRHSKKDTEWLRSYRKAIEVYKMSPEKAENFANLIEQGFTEEEAVGVLPMDHNPSPGGAGAPGRSTTAILQMIDTGAPLDVVPDLCYDARVARRKEAERICAMMKFFRETMIAHCDGKTPEEIIRGFSQEFAAVARHVLTESGAGDF